MPDTNVPRHQRSTKLKKFLFGAPYYPEHWEAADRELDGQRMKDAGVNVARMAEFAWDVIEPSRDHFDFSLFDETIETLSQYGVDSFLCTPTATPPRWLTAGKPEWLRVTADGVRMQHGSRQHVCTNNEAFRAESQRITRAMAEHYRDNPNVIGWQTDNELNCSISVCYCDTCRRDFQNWLEQKYQNIDELNRRWGNRFWSQTYTRFDQIELPRPGGRPAPGNPTQALDFSRYLSDGVIRFQAEQVAILREVQPNWWITHNGTFRKIDHWDFVEDLDFYAVDIYPGFADIGPENFFWASLQNESARTSSGGYIVPEQAGGAGGQMDYMNQTSEPGQMRLWAYQSIACGADGILHFRWRTCRFGAEIYWNGILDHDNKLRRRYEEFAQEGRELQKIGPAILGSVKEVKIGILCDYLNREMYESQTNGFPSPKGQIQALFSQGAWRHLPIGVLDPRDSFAGMEILVLPTHMAEDLELTSKLEAFVEAGGTLLVTARSYTRSEDNFVLPVTAPASLRNLLGISREEEGRLLEGMDEFTMTTTRGETLMGVGGYEILKLHGAESVADWNVGVEGRHPHPAQGQCGLSVNTFGQGKAFYFGSYINKENVGTILDLLLEASPVAPQASAAAAVETAIRHKPGQRLLFLLNHTLEAQTVTDIPTGTDLLSEQPMGNCVELEPYGVRIIALGQ